MKRLLEKYALFLSRIYLSKHKGQILAVVGSIGKTSTTQALISVLGQKFDVIGTKKNYNTPAGLAMTLFDQQIPESTVGWLKVMLVSTLRSLFTKPKCEIFILELSTDKLGDIGQFSFIDADLAVVTAIAPEHMENFGDLENVAKEELCVASFSKKLLVNADLVSQEYLEKYAGKTLVEKYGQGQKYSVHRASEYKLVGRSGESILSASTAVASLLGMSTEETKLALQKLEPLPGRMNILHGKNDSIIIDDTYNSSPEAVRSALDYLYAQDSKQKIAILGNMNEMGEKSQELHELVGSWCDPEKLDMVVTLGPDANEYLATSAEKRSCKVLRANSPREAGEQVLNALSNGAIVLAKGSQNGVYAEEAVKLLLADPANASKLVRQDTYWPKKKSKYWVSL